MCISDFVKTIRQGIRASSGVCRSSALRGGALAFDVAGGPRRAQRFIAQDRPFGRRSRLASGQSVDV